MQKEILKIEGELKEIPDKVNVVKNICNIKYITIDNEAIGKIKTTKNILDILNESLNKNVKFTFIGTREDLKILATIEVDGNIYNVDIEDIKKISKNTKIVTTLVFINFTIAGAAFGALFSSMAHSPAPLFGLVILMWCLAFIIGATLRKRLKQTIKFFSKK